MGRSRNTGAYSKWNSRHLLVTLLGMLSIFGLAPHTTDPAIILAKLKSLVYIVGLYLGKKSIEWGAKAYQNSKGVKGGGEDAL